MMSIMLRTVLLLVPLFIVLFVFDLLRKRREIRDLPQPPMPNKLFGHLYLALELRRLFPDGCHGQFWAEYIRIKYNQPDVFYIDWRPLGPLLLCIADPEVAALPIITTLTTTKSRAVKKWMVKILGNRNIITAHGAEWKALRGLFAPAFQSQNVACLTDSVVDSCLTFRNVLHEKARTGALFKLNEVTLRATVEMICGVVFGVQIPCQLSMHPMVRLFLDRILMMPNAFFLWEDVKSMLFSEWKIRANKKALDASINMEIDHFLARRHAKQAGNVWDDPTASEKTFGKDDRRSIVNMALSVYEKQAGVTITTPAELPPSLRLDIVDSIKAIIFAGYDATSATLCWTLYLLRRYPEKQHRLVKELNSVFPCSSTETASAIKNDHSLMRQLTYTTAVIKETLRLFPPASGLRAGGQKVETLTHPKTGEQYPMWPHCAVWPNALMIHRNTRFFPDPLEFVPERWIPDLSPYPHAELFTTRAGRDAFRAFGKGPRQCIGSELAMLQMSVVLALTTRELDFIPEYPGESPDVQYPTPINVVDELDDSTEYGKGVREKRIRRDRIEGHRMYMQLVTIGKPVDGAPGRVYFRESC